MKVVILGGVAAGTKTAAKLKREDPGSDIHIYTKGKDISYAGCGLPYYIGGSIETEDKLIVNTPEKFMKLTGTTVHTGHEATDVNFGTRTVTFRSGETTGYDRLVIATGAEPFIPPVDGTKLEGVFTVRTPQDAIFSRNYIKSRKSRKAVVVGAGFIGLEVAENLVEQGLQVTVIDMADQILSNIFDVEMADFAKRKLIESGIDIMNSCTLKEIIGDRAVTGIVTDSCTLDADIVFLAIGIRPSTDFLKDSGIAMHKGTIITDRYGKTNMPDVYAVGDCALVRNRITGRPQWSAMGSTANIAGRAMAVSMSGGDIPYPGVLGTGVVKLSKTLNAARTGLTEKQAREAEMDVETIVTIHDDKAHYYFDSSTFVVKTIADRKSHKLLGMQVFGKGAVDKMADVAVTAISMNARIDDIITMDFAYAPPFSTAIHPFAAACGSLLNKIEGKLESFTPLQFREGKAKEYRLIDVLPRPALAHATWFDLTEPQKFLDEFDKDAKLLLVCARGKRAYLTQNKLKSLGFKNTRVLEGGEVFNGI